MGKKLTKVRVQIIDKETKLPKEDVDVMTSTDAVLFPDGDSIQEKWENGEFKGDTGDDGTAATIKVANTITVDSDKSAYVENIGTISSAVLNFYIPKGERGEHGTSIKILGRFDNEEELIQNYPDGSVLDGGFMVGPEDIPQEYYYWDHINSKWTSAGTIQGPKGENGEKGNPGEDGMGLSIINSFKTYEEMVAFYPDGSVCGGSGCVTTNTGEYWYWNYISLRWTSIGCILGIEGPKGDTGAAATIMVEETKTLDPYRDAFVENIGTDNDARLVFNIPRGAPGNIPDIDNMLSLDSTNPLENKVITENFNSINNKINDLNNRLDQLEGVIDRLIDNINKIIDRLSKLEARIDKLEKDIDRLERRTMSMTEGSSNISEILKLT